MIDYVKIAVCEMSQEINNQNHSSIYLLYGDEGIGKSTIAKYYSEVNKNVLYLRCGNEFDFLSLVSKIKPKKNYDRHLCLYQPLIKKIKKKHINTLIFDIEANTDEDFFDLISEIFDVINQQRYNLNIIIFLDNKIYHNYQKIFAKYRRLNYLRPLRKWEPLDFFQLWCELYGEDSLNKEILGLIISYSIGNPGIFLQHLNMLKYYRILNYKEDKWIFTIKTNIKEILEEEYSVIVRKKYESLTPELQSVIKQTSAIGYIFQKTTLKDVFDVQNAKIVIRQIELLTKLLYYTDMEMENGKFDSEAVQHQIEKMIDSEQLIIWCEALAKYYEKKIENTGYISPERCVLKEKCIIYYTKAQNTERLVFHYLSLIQLKYNLNQYNSALAMVIKLEEITRNHLEYKRINNYCYYMMTVINRSLANYTEAYNNINQYITLIKKETTDIKALKAELLYGVGNTPEAYDILKSLYKNRQQIDDPILKVYIISMLSSIEETLNDIHYINHFNNAISIAKEYQLHKEYYRLLRKANMAHFGENSIMLMNIAEHYFLKHNIISEVVMVQHNIGTESLFYETTYKYAFNKLNQAYTTAQKMGFSQLSYINNSLAIYYMFEGQYEKAIHILNHLMEFQHEDFTFLAVYLNMVTCLRCVGRHEQALHYLNKAKDLNSKEENQFPFFSSQIIMQSAYLYLEHHEYYKAYLKVQEYFNQHFEDRVTNIVSAKLVLKVLCDMQNVDYPTRISQFSDDSDIIAKKMAEEHLVLCELMFWE